MKNRLEYACQIAKQRTETQMEVSKRRYDIRAKKRSFAVGDKVLLTLPTTSSKFTSQWKGPFEVAGVVPNSNVNYVVKVDGTEKTYHVDMMQEFVSRAPDLVPDTISVNDSDTLTESNVDDKSLKASDSVLIGTASSPLLNSFEPYACKLSIPSVIPASSVRIIYEDSDPIDPGYTNDFFPILFCHHLCKKRQLKM